MGRDIGDAHCYLGGVEDARGRGVVVEFGKDIQSLRKKDEV